MSIASEITRINTNIAAAYSSCSDKGAAMPQSRNSANLADTIDSIPQGGGITPDAKDVNFYDFDGTLLYSYTSAEAAALTALPALPSREGLVCQGWNYTLAEIRDEPDRVNVGCYYTTSDGATRLYISAMAGELIEQLSVNLRVAAQNTVTVDWGDGTTSELLNTDVLPQNKRASHSYAPPGSDTVFCIRIVGGSFELNTTSQQNMFNNKFVPLERVELGTNCTMISASSFRLCYGLRSVSISNSVTGIGGYAFFDCFSLKSVSIPNSVTVIGASAFQECYGLSFVSIPNSVTNIGGSAFYECHRLIFASIPSSITALGQNIFFRCKGLKNVVLPDTVLSVSGNTFYECANLRSIRFSEEMSSISSSMMHNCPLLSRIVIPSSVNSIGSYAFFNCGNLKTVDLSAFTDPAHIPALQDDAVNSVFYNTPAVFYVASAEMLTAFSGATNWSSLPSSRFQIKGV